MKSLSSLIERIAKSLNKDSINKEAVESVLLEKISPNLKLEEISIKDGVLIISASPGIKQAIKMREKEVLEALRHQHNLRLSRVLYK